MFGLLLCTGVHQKRHKLCERKTQHLTNVHVLLHVRHASELKLGAISMVMIYGSAISMVMIYGSHQGMVGMVSSS